MAWNDKALRAAQTQRGLGHVSLVAIKNDMADILQQTGRIEESIGVLYSIVCLQRELHKGADSPDIALVCINTGLIGIFYIEYATENIHSTQFVISSNRHYINCHELL